MADSPFEVTDPDTDAAAPALDDKRRPAAAPRTRSYDDPAVRQARLLLLALAAFFLLAAPAASAEKLRLATIAPANSTWGKLLVAWQKAVQKSTDGRLEIQVYYNAVQGDEAAMVAKLRTGQLDGAALSTVGLSLIHRDVMVLQLPGVTNSWPLVDMARKILGPPIVQGLREQGFELVSWGDIGRVHQMSRGFAIRTPADLRGRRPMTYRNEPIGPMIYSLIGKVVPVPLAPTEVLPSLRAGTIDAVAAPLLAAEQLQWTPFLDHIGEQVIACATGGTVVRRSRLEAIPADVRERLERLHRRLAVRQNDLIRRLDSETWARLSRRMQVVRLTDDEKVEWYRLYLKAIRRLRHGIFSRELIEQALEITGKG